MSRNRKPPPSTKARLWLWALLVAALIAASIWLREQSPRRQPGERVVATNQSPTAPAAGFKLESDAATFAKYAGSASCRECHEKSFAGWTNSHHALAERAVEPALDRVAFDPPQKFKHGAQTSEARADGGRFEIVTLGEERAIKPHVAQRVIGVNPLRQFLIATTNGRLQSTEIAFDPHKGDWFDVYGNEDRRPGEWGHWTGRGMTWNTMCAACHNTRLRKNYRESDDTFDTRMAEMGVGCEACHGPMAQHVVWQRKFPKQKGDPTVQKFDRPQILATCGSCHARRGELTGDFVPGDAFHNHYALTIPDETELFYPDGQVREEDYEFTAFLGSKMNLAGVRCIDCHDPHSGKTLAQGDALCMRCHGPPLQPALKIDPTTHSFHKPGESGSHCVECHMPVTTYMARHPRHDHGFTIPDPLLTKQHKIPNACNRCHTDKSVDWALEAVQKWYGPKMERPTRARAQTIAKARAGQRDALAGLLNLAREEKNPQWRASATILLRPWCNDSNVTARLLEKTGDPDPLVRAMAVRALEPAAAAPEVRAALRRLLADPSRLVRVDAAWALHTEVDMGSPAGADLMHYLRHNLDQPSALLQLGVYHLDGNRPDLAVNYFQRALNMDANSAPTHDALAMGLSAQGKTADAVRELEAACRLDAANAEYRYQLGLALNESGRPAEALAALAQAVKLEPRFARAWYNLGLAYSGAGQPEQALEALLRAESLDAQSARAPYARATILVRLGRQQEARNAARRALEIQPSHAEAAQLLQQLSP